MSSRFNSAWAQALSLCIALAISVSLLIWPALAVSADSRVNHGWLTLLMWGMAAGFVHGVGFMPRNRLLRIALGPVTAWGLTLLAMIALSIA
ncbi:MAG: cyd operon YbgE family protein [Gammaproteobacteria bacterium]|nr:cyd operon YbgE family protein [Gammaproteobacteria bacterium]